MQSPQTPGITGYRPLDAKTVERMNRAKALGEDLGAFIKELESIIEVDKVWLNESKLELQKGMMCLVRSIAKPLTF